MTEKRVDLTKNVYDKDQYLKTIDNSFRELGVSGISEDIEQQTSVEEFFGFYNSLFYDIPTTGNTNSHEFLVKQSGNYIGFEANQEEIEALQNEITQLRTELLNAQIRITELETGNKITLNTSSLEESSQEVNQVLVDAQNELEQIANI